METILETLGIIITTPLPLVELLIKVKTALKGKPNKTVMLPYHFGQDGILNMNNHARLITKHCNWKKDTHEDIDMEENEPQNLQRIYSCLNCDFMTQEMSVYITHETHGEYAKGHKMYRTGRQDARYFIYTILSHFSRKENNMECKICSKSFHKDKMQDMYNHCTKEHGYRTGATDESLEEFLKTLMDHLYHDQMTSSSIAPSRTKTHFCIKCTKLFNTLTDLYTHYITTDHSTMFHAYCSECTTELHTTICPIKHIENFHNDVVTCPILEDWDCKIDIKKDDLAKHIREHYTWELQTSNQTSDSMLKDVIAETIYFSPQKQLNENTLVKHEEGLGRYPDRKSTTMTKLLLEEQDMKVSLETTPLNQLIKEMFVMQPPSIPSPIIKALAGQFPRLINYSIPLPVMREQTTEDVMFGPDEEEIKTVTTFDIVKGSYPFLLIGSKILRNIIICEADQSTSHNYSDNITRYWPTQKEKEYPGTILHLQKPQTMFKLDYFTRINEILFGLKDYKGIVCLEADIQALLSQGHDNTALITDLARGFLHGITELIHRPKYLMVIGAINNQPEQIKNMGPWIAKFNAQLKYLLYHSNITFLDPNNLAVKTVKTTTNGWKSMVPMQGIQGIFDTRSNKTMAGLQRYNAWLTDIATLAQQIAARLDLPMQHAIIE